MRPLVFDLSKATCTRVYEKKSLIKAPDDPKLACSSPGKDALPFESAMYPPFCFLSINDFGVSAFT